MRQNKIETVMSFVELVIDFPTLVTETKLKYTIGRNWVWKNDLVKYLKMDVFAFINKVEVEMVDMAVNKVEVKVNKGGRMNSVMEFEYDGTCYDYACSGKESNQYITEMFNDLNNNGFGDAMDLNLAKTKLNAKAGIIYNIMASEFPSIDIDYVKEDAVAYDGDTGFSDKFSNVFTTVKSLTFTNTEGRVFNFPDFKLEIEMMGGDHKRYHKLSTIHAKLRSMFWDAHRTGKTMWADTLNPIVAKHADMHNVEGDKVGIKDVIAGIKEIYTAYPTVAIDFLGDKEDSVAVCSCCGSDMVRVNSTKSHLEHLGIKAFDVQREMREWTTCGADGIKYIFDGKTEVVNGKTMARITGEYRDWNSVTSLDLDIQRAADDFIIDVDVDTSFDLTDFDLDISIEAGMNDTSFARNNAGVEQDIADDVEVDELANMKVITGCAAEFDINPWDTDYTDYTDRMNEQDESYRNHVNCYQAEYSEYGYMDEGTCEEAANKATFLRALDAIFGDKQYKKEMREVEQTFVESGYRDFESLMTFDAKGTITVPQVL